MVFFSSLLLTDIFVSPHSLKTMAHLLFTCLQKQDQLVFHGYVREIQSLIKSTHPNRIDSTVNVLYHSTYFTLLPQYLGIKSTSSNNTLDHQITP